jgi:uncharacterized membrane protein
MRLFKTEQLATAGFMAALVMVGTLIIQIPTPTEGYIHIGDSMVYLCGILLGPVLGSLAAAIGSAAADLISGYTIYAPATFLIKGVEALVTGACFYAVKKKSDSLWRITAASLCGICLGGLLMVSGYLAYETFLYGFPTAVLSMVANITQAAGGGLLALPLILTLQKYKRY